MAIAQMKKFMIASHRSEASAVLEALQRAGIVQILDAERAMVSKQWPELEVKSDRPKNLEDIVSRLGKSISFLEGHAVEDSPKSFFKPLIPVNQASYTEIIDGTEGSNLLEDAEASSNKIEYLLTEKENMCGHLEMLLPWAGLSTPVEEFEDLETVCCLTGRLPSQNLEETKGILEEFSAIVEVVGERNGLNSCLVLCMKDKVSNVQKSLRSGDFESVSFEGLSGTVDELIADSRVELGSIEEKLVEAKDNAEKIASDLLKLQMLFDHNSNLLGREEAGASCPATENTVLFEGWVRKNDYKRLEKLVGAYGCSSLNEIEIGEDEVAPVEIDNGRVMRPFETITRLYGMPSPKDVDPTMFLAPFFALFFGLCLTDAGYGLILIALLGWALKKFQGTSWMSRPSIACAQFKRR